MIKLMLDKYIYFFVLLIIANSGYCQKTRINHVHFIRVVASQSYPLPPFERKEIEISNSQICYQTVFPPKEENNNHVVKNDEISLVTDCTIPTPTDYDSIVHFILNSGLLNIDLNYTKPFSVNGVIMEKVGGGNYGYTIETSEGIIELPIYGSTDFKIPEVLVNFNALFHRITARYPQ